MSLLHVVGGRPKEIGPETLTALSSPRGWRSTWKTPDDRRDLVVFSMRVEVVLVNRALLGRGPVFSTRVEVVRGTNSSKGSVARSSPRGWRSSGHELLCGGKLIVFSTYVEIVHTSPCTCSNTPSLLRTAGGRPSRVMPSCIWHQPSPHGWRLPSVICEASWRADCFST